MSDKMDSKSASNDVPSAPQENEEDDANVITMVDVLKEENELEEDANAVLGGSDPKNCTYPKGYVKRQAVYSCLTCVPASPDNKPAGMCLACSYSCHEGHKLVEMYTKRNFCCDCGNELFGGNKCNLEAVKGLNEKNKYNQNFRGLYCTCHRPYPDSEDSVADEMIQCIMCEDWHHGRHLGTDIPSNDYGEMICESCMKENPFLWNYAGICITKVKPTEEEPNVEVDVSSPSKSAATPSSNGIETPSKSGSSTEAAESTSQTPAQSIPSTSDAEVDSAVCKLTTLQQVEPRKGATFWPTGWRKHLCSCQTCKELYISKSVEYLTDIQDTVLFYEEQGKEKCAAGQSGSQYDQAMQALSSLDRVAQVEALHGYNDMKDQLKEYLQKFAENRKVVREEDIREFFEQMSRKRRRVDIPSSFCR